MTRALRLVRQRLRTVLMVLCLVAAPMAAAKSISELAELARGATFEVVLPKVEPQHVTYEKALPVELLSFTERNDAFWSIGTAFALAPDVFVSNAHVLLSGMGSQLGRPHLRDAAGNTHEIVEILKFSLHEDFIVFRARGARATVVLQPGPVAPQVGARVFSVGNALGEGVVVRDGLLTSLTPEEQDGRWQWLRFSAAASPGNSGGPLLDEQGRILGIVTARSAGENLNYALPIERVILASERNGNIDIRESFGLPILRQQMVTRFKGSVPLPMEWPEFSSKMLELSAREHEANQTRMLEAHAADIPPAGRSARFLGTLDRTHPFALISQQSDDTWGLTALEDGEVTRPGDDESLEIGTLAGITGFIWRHSVEGGIAPPPQRDSTAFMDGLLKGLQLPRIIGPQAIRITSLGPAAHEDAHTDRFGRLWQLRHWPLGYADLQVVTMALPTPDGYVGLARLSTAAGHARILAELRLLADYVHALYSGTPQQWRSFVASREWCPPMLRGIRFDEASGTYVELATLQAQIPAELLQVEERSRLNVYMGYAAREDQLVAQPAGLMLEMLPDDESSWIGVWGQRRPGDQAGAELHKRWRQMSARGPGFDGKPQRDSATGHYWTSSAIGDPETGLQYEITLSLKETSLLLPRELAEKRDALHAGLLLTEE